MKMKILVVICVIVVIFIVFGVQVQIKIIYVGMNGGMMEKNYIVLIFFDFEKVNNVKVVVVFGIFFDIIVKMQVQCDKLQMYVVFFDDGIMYCVINMSLCEKVKDVVVFKDVYFFVCLVNDQVVVIEMGVFGIGYNKKLFVEKGWLVLILWMDFVDFKYKQKVVFQLILVSIFGLYGFMMFNCLVGGIDKNVDFGFKKWGSIIGFNVVEYFFSLVKIFEMVQINEVVIFLLIVIGIVNLKDKGIFVEFVIFKEGGVLFMIGVCFIKGNSELELVQKLLEYLLILVVQVKSMVLVNLILVNCNVLLLDVV